MQHQFYRIEVDIGNLTVYGLLKPRVRASSYTSSSEAETTPTLLGLELYARGHGHRGPLEEFYLQRDKGTPRNGEAPDQAEHTLA